MRTGSPSLVRAPMHQEKTQSMRSEGEKIQTKDTMEQEKAYQVRWVPRTKRLQTADCKYGGPIWDELFHMRTTSAKESP